MFDKETIIAIAKNQWKKLIPTLKGIWDKLAPYHTHIIIGTGVLLTLGIVGSAFLLIQATTWTLWLLNTATCAYGIAYAATSLYGHYQHAKESFPHSGKTWLQKALHALQVAKATINESLSDYVAMFYISSTMISTLYLLSFMMSNIVFLAILWPLTALSVYKTHQLSVQMGLDHPWLQKTLNMTNPGYYLGQAVSLVITSMQMLAPTTWMVPVAIIKSLGNLLSWPTVQALTLGCVSARVSQFFKKDETTEASKTNMKDETTDFTTDTTPQKGPKPE